MPTQVQQRGAAQSTQEARTLVSREVDINTTDWRLNIHDGATAGGVPHVNFSDQQNQEFVWLASVSGTNTITGNAAKAPAAYQAGQRFVFEAANTNTGSASLNINSLGAKTLKKKDVFGGAIATLDAGDLIQGGIYTVFYDGTDFILESVDAGGIENVSQGDINTSSGTFSAGVLTANDISVGGSIIMLSSVGSTIAAPGGQYGFAVESRAQNASGPTSGWWPANHTASYANRQVPFVYRATAVAGTVYGRQRYITSSPPFDIGDGECGGFMFLKVNKNGDVLQSYIADVPPWGYNGPTDIRAQKICRATGCKYRKALKPMTAEMIADGATPEYEWQEITQDIKNADMGLLPHPFDAPKKGESIILLNPYDDITRRLIEYQNAGGEDVVDALQNKKIRPDNDSISGLKAKPKGVMISRVKT